MKRYFVPIREEVSTNNQNIFDHLERPSGRMPNLHAVFEYSEIGLKGYLVLQKTESILSIEEQEIINLIVSQASNFSYGGAAHATIAEIQDFSDEQIIEIRKAKIKFDTKLAGLAKLVKDIIVNRGWVGEDNINAFYAAGYDYAAVVDTCIQIGCKAIDEYLYNITQVPADWPLSPSL
jgi:hypothetical protein